MQRKTEIEYQRRAEHFYKRFKGDITPKLITDMLNSIATEYTPASWRGLRNAIAFDQERKGFKKAADRIRGLKNPLTKDGNIQKDKIKPKQRRVKSVNDADLAKLSNAIDKKDDPLLKAALIIAKTTGCRPKEMPGIVIEPDGTVFIPSAKKAMTAPPGAKGKHFERGLDRYIKVKDKSALEELRSAVSVLEQYGRSGRIMAVIQSRLNRVTKKIWPRRKHRPSIYSFRHQMGSNLKASGLDRQVIGYIMGHQSTSSVDEYGDRRSGSSGLGIEAAESHEAIKELVRVAHTEPPKTQKPAIDRSVENKYEIDLGY